MLKEILLSIQDRLQQEVSELRFIDEDWGQLEYDQPQVQFPCTLIDADGFTYTQMGQLCQQGAGEIYIRIADMKLGKTSSRATEKQKQSNLQFLDLIDKIHHVLHGYTTGEYSPLIRTNLKRVRRDDKMREYVMTYKTAYNEESTLPKLTPIYAQINIQDENK